MASKIRLTKGRVVLVDDEDFEYLNQWKWYFDAGYARRTIYNINKYGKNGRKIYMHRLILDAPKNLEVDHINRDSLDNRKCNIRLATHAQNQQNKGVNKNNTSGYKGVSWCKQTGKWRAGLKVNAKYLNLGRFTDIKEAVRVRNEAIALVHGEFARQK